MGKFIPTPKKTIEGTKKMNYEELFLEMQCQVKEMGDSLKNQQKAFKSLCKNLELGDLKSFTKDMATMESLYEGNEKNLQKMQETEQGFDAKEYIHSGDFADQMLDYCKAIGVDVKGEFPIYEMFPYKIRIDSENLDMYIDRKKTQCLRPIGFINSIKSAQDKLLKASFNPTIFANELVQAYDLCLLKQNAGKEYAHDGDCYLINIYKALTPMKRFKKDYDQQSFAFDLARLYDSEARETEDGRMLQFGTSRNIKKAIRILDCDGKEQYLATIRFY